MGVPRTGDVHVRAQKSQSTVDISHYFHFFAFFEADSGKIILQKNKKYFSESESRRYHIFQFHFIIASFPGNHNFKNNSANRYAS